MNRSTLTRSAKVRAAAEQAAAIVAARRGWSGGLAMHSDAVIDRLEAERRGCEEFIQTMLESVAAEGRDLVDAETANLAAKRERMRKIDDQLEPLRDFQSLQTADNAATRRYTPSGGGDPAPESGRTGAGAQVTDRAHKWRSVGEFLADVYKASPAARRQGQRIERHVAEGAAARLRSVGLEASDGPLVRAAAPHNTTDEVPGLLPTQIIGEIISDVDAARPFIQSVGPRDLGGIPGLSFERPTITQHVKVDKQADEKTEVANRQFLVGGIPFTKDTYGGWANVSRQSIDWTSPGVWDALMSDFIEQYALETENDAADAFAASVVQTQELSAAATIGAVTVDELLVALYAAAGKSYQGGGRLPDTIWAGLDWWAVLGPLLDKLQATAGGGPGIGDSSMATFSGNLLRVNRVVVPSFPNETLIVGVRNRYEVYEDRFGFLSVVEPKVFGVEIAYGGYMASGNVKPAAFTKITKNVP